MLVEDINDIAFFSEHKQKKINENLTVVGKYENKFDYIVFHCKECAKDPELNKEGYFAVSRCYVRQGIIPCRCSKSAKYSKYQASIIIKRAEDISNGVKYIGDFDSEYKTAKSKLTFKCEDHGIFKLALDAVNLKLKQGRTLCAVCVGHGKPENRELDCSVEKANRLYKEDGFIFERSDRLSKDGVKSYLKYTCPICSNDEYVKNGLCSGVFELTVGQISNHVKSCRCSHAYRWTEDQRYYQINKIIKEENLKDKFVGFVDGYKNNESKIIRFCEDHGEYETIFKNFFSQRKACPRCYNARYRNNLPGHLYLVRWYGYGEEFLKFGITNREPIERIKEQSYKSDLDFEILYTFYNEDGKYIENLERIIKSSVETNICPKNWMRSGHTETTYMSNLDKILDIIRS